MIVGPNGAGKTQAAHDDPRREPAARGHVTLDGARLYDAARGVDLPVEQRRIGFLPQRYALFPHLDVAGERRLRNRGADAGRAPRDWRARRSPSSTSRRWRRGGPPSFRAARRSGSRWPARCAARPRALLLDEPLAALDVSVRRDTRRFLVERLRAWALPTVVVTHDRADAEALDGDVVVLEAGAVAQRGRLDQLEAHPATEFVKELVAGGRR